METTVTLQSLITEAGENAVVALTEDAILITSAPYGHNGNVDIIEVNLATRLAHFSVETVSEYGVYKYGVHEDDTIHVQF